MATVPVLRLYNVIHYTVSQKHAFTGDWKSSLAPPVGRKTIDRHKDSGHFNQVV